MRKIRIMAALATVVAGLLLSTGCDDEQRISYGKLPAAARTFIETFFPTERCEYAERDRDDGRKEYEVRLSGGTEIRFDAAGAWIEVDCKFSLLPAGIAPERIVEDLATRYPDAGIYKIERQTGGYEVSISNGRKLIYTADGTFVREERD